jgi:uncharacterized protein (DUF342 family)
VRIKGDVLPDFSVKAKKGIIVSGSCQEATLICPEGDINVKGYVYGGPQARIVAGGGFECNVAQELEAEAAGNITISKEATDCSLRTQASLFMEQGALVGGKTLAVCGVAAKFIGNEALLPTAIKLCSDVEMTADYCTLVSNIDSHEKALKLMDLHLGPFAASPKKVERLAGPHRIKMEKLLKKKEEIQASLIRLLLKRDEKVAGAHTNSVMRVNFLGKLYPGTTVRVADDLFTSKEVLEGPASLDYSPTEHSFVVGELKGLECTVKVGTPPTKG